MEKIAARVIKFRAWNKDNQMSEPFTLDNIIDYGTIIQGLGKYVVRLGDCTDCELMQFTGILDKNGKEIFEGDILFYDHCTEQKNCIVEFIDGCFKAHDGKHNYHDLDGGPSRGWTILGNIYESPELAARQGEK